MGHQFRCKRLPGHVEMHVPALHVQTRTGLFDMSSHAGQEIQAIELMVPAELLNAPARIIQSELRSVE